MTGKSYRFVETVGGWIVFFGSLRTIYESKPGRQPVRDYMERIGGYFEIEASFGGVRKSQRQRGFLRRWTYEVVRWYDKI